MKNSSCLDRSEKSDPDRYGVEVSNTERIWNVDLI